MTLDHEEIDVSILWMRDPGGENEVSKIVSSLTNGRILTSPSEIFLVAEDALAKDQDGDLGKSLLWAAASLGSRNAAALLARKIEILVSDDKSLSGPQQRRMVSLAATWRRNASEVKFHKLSRLAGDHPGIGHDDGEVDGFDADFEAPPGLVVVSSVGGADLGAVRSRCDGIVGLHVPFAASVPAAGFVASRILEKWPWAADLADRLEDRSAIARSTGQDRIGLDPMLLVGPAGVGKTRLAMTVASVLGLPSLMLDASAASDGDALAGVSREWRSCRPCAPVEVIQKTDYANPVVIVDNIDRSSSNGRPGKLFATLGAMLDHPSQYQDAFFQSEVDLSAVTFIATAASADALPSNVRDKFEIVAIPHPEVSHLPAIVASMSDAESARLGVLPGLLPELPEEAMEIIKAMIVQKSSLRLVSRMYRRLLAAAAKSEHGRLNLVN